MEMPVILTFFNTKDLTLQVYGAHTAEVAGVTFSDSNSAPVPKFFNPGTAFLQF